MVEDVRSLSPGCVLTVGEDGAQKVERFWRPSFELKNWKNRYPLAVPRQPLQTVSRELLPAALVDLEHSGSAPVQALWAALPL